LSERCVQTAIPFFYLVEKKYFICAKAVGTFFDSNYNPLVDPEEATHPDVRKLRAELPHNGGLGLVQCFSPADRLSCPALLDQLRSARH
jgi:hypothetical protein